MTGPLDSLVINAAPGVLKEDTPRRSLVVRRNDKGRPRQARLGLRHVPAGWMAPRVEPQPAQDVVTNVSAASTALGLVFSSVPLSSTMFGGTRN